MFRSTRSRPRARSTLPVVGTAMLALSSLFAMPVAAAPTPLTNLAHLDFLGDTVTAAGAGGPHDLPSRDRAEPARPVDLRGAASGWFVPASRGRHVPPGHEHLWPGRVQHRRPDAGSRRVHPPLEAVRGRSQPRRGLRAAPGRDLHADVDRRFAPGQLRALDAAGRDAESQRGPEGAAGSIRFGRRVLAGAIDLGAGRRLRGLPERRRRLRRLPAHSPRARPRRARSRSSRPLRHPSRVRRGQLPGVADR